MKQVYLFFIASFVSFFAINHEAKALTQDSEGYYLIGNADDFKAFAEMVNDRNADNTRINGRLTADIRYSDAGYNTVIGFWESTPYRGTFDGNGFTFYGEFQVDSKDENRVSSWKQLTGGNYATDYKYIGLFKNVDGCTIKNLKLDGSIISNLVGAAGLIGKSYGNVTISRCIVLAAITTSSTENASGFVCSVETGNLTIDNCAFRGHITGNGTGTRGGTKNVGSFIADVKESVSVLISNSYVYADLKNTIAKSTGVLVGNSAVTVYYQNTYYSLTVADFEWATGVDLEQGSSRTQGDFNNGTVCKLLNTGKTAEDAVWFQTIDEDDYPVLDNTHDVHVPIQGGSGDEVIWIGGSDDNWANPENWSSGAVPSLSDNVVIDNDYVIIKSQVNVNSISVRGEGIVLFVGEGGIFDGSGVGNLTLDKLQVEDGASVVLTNNSILRVEDLDVEDGSFYAVYKEDVSPSLVINGSVKGNVEFVRTLSRKGCIYYCGTSTNEGNIAGTTVTEDDYLFSDNEIVVGLNSSSFIEYFDTDEKNGGWQGNFASDINRFNSNDGWYTAHAVGVLNSEGGFAQIGTPHLATADDAITMLKGWPWYNNPYPYTVDLNAFYTENKTSFDNGKIEPTVWVRRFIKNVGYGWVSYNLTTGLSTDGSIMALAPFQCANYHVCSSAEMVMPHEVSKAHVGLKGEELINDVLRVGAFCNDNKESDDNVVLLFRNIGSFEPQVFGADSKINDNMKVSTTQLVLNKPESDVNLAIACYPAVGEAKDVELPLTVNAGRNLTKLVLKANNVKEFDSTVDPYLVDHLTDAKVNLREQDYEVPELASVASAGRFAIVLKDAENEEVVTENAAVKSNGIFKAHAEGANIVAIATGDNQGKNVVVYNMQGSVVASKDMASGVAKISMPMAGIYVVKCGNESFKVRVK